MYARRNLRRVDVLVNNAGIYLEVSGTTVKDRISAFDARLEVVRAIVETNLIGPFALSQGVIALMRDRGHGRVVSVTSAMGQLSDMGGGGLALGKWRALLKERGAFHGQAAATIREGI
jgi:NAD(P)-dependent dehydrogenase (short-subunit alcohol dehydrogenase family)